MAIKKCHDCGKELSTSAKACPHCGAPQARRTSLVTWVVVAVVGYMAYSCASVMGDLPGGTVGTGATSTTSAPTCSAKDFTISDLKGKREYDYLTITARLHNGCKIAAGAQIKVSTYDAAGTLIDTKDIWPASVRNIEPGGHENFKTMFRDTKGTKNFDTQVLSVKVWK